MLFGVFSNSVFFFRVKELAIDDNVDEPFRKRPAVGAGPLEAIREGSPNQMGLHSPNNNDLALISSLCVSFKLSRQF